MLKLNNLNFIFFVGENDENENFKIVYKLNISLNGLNENKISDLEKILNEIKKKFFQLNKNLITFKEVMLILDNYELTFINLTGF